MMIERISAILCHPKRIGNYFKDKGLFVFLLFLIFLGLYAGCTAAYSYNTKPFTDNSSAGITSILVQGTATQVSYDATTKTMSGKTQTIEKKSYRLVFLPAEGADITTKYDDITIIFEATYAQIYYGTILAGTCSYENLDIASFSTKEIQLNSSSDIFAFKQMVDSVLVSGYVFFQTYLFLQSVGTALVYFVFIVGLMYFFSFFNPSIERGIRFKLCIYDGLSFFVISIFSVLFNAGWLTYVAVLVPMIYSFITFKHIVKVIVRK